MGPFGLIRERRRVAVADSVRVYPNFKAVSRFALLATDNRAAEVGVHTRQRRGQGLEFMQLREYREVTLRRSTGRLSRHNRLISESTAKSRTSRWCSSSTADAACALGMATSPTSTTY